MQNLLIGDVLTELERR